MTNKLLFTGKALTMKQPWASAIAFGGKDIENRCWYTRFRGPLAIHAGKGVYRDGFDWQVGGRNGGKKKTVIEWINQGHKRYGMPAFEEGRLIAGHIIAIANVVDCVARHKSPWFEGEFGFVLEDVVPIEPVKRNGALGLWNCRFKYDLLEQ